MITRRWFPVLAFFAVAAIAWVVVGISVELWWNNPAHLVAHPPRFPDRPFLEGWARWDAGWYLGIARQGYTHRGPDVQSSVAFFPGYPLTIRAGGWLIGDQGRAAILVTLGCGLGVAVMFHHWCAARIGERPAAFALGVLLTYPFAFYLFGAVYGDALFIAAVLGAFLLLEKDLPVLAGLVGIVATATRPVGAAVVVGLVVRVLEREGVLVGSPFTRARALVTRLVPVGAPGSAGSAQGAGDAPPPRISWFPRRVDLTCLRLRDAGVLLSGLGLAGYVVYLWDRFGEPLAFEQVAGAKGWDQAPGLHTWFKLGLGSRILQTPYETLDVALVGQALITLGLLLLVPAVVRRFGWGYGAYSLVIVLLPAISTKDFGGMGRYGLAAFPCIAVIGLWLERRPTLGAVYLVGSGTVMLVCLILYSHFVYLS
jgi:hypothetical protein